MSISIIIYIVLALGALIFFHELGHFAVARLFGVGVEKFSLGFGPRIVGRKIGITDYRISAIPLGGFVKMVGEEPDSELAPEEIPLSFTHKHVVKRILIVAAGPTANLLLAVFIFFAFFAFTGIEDIRPVIRQVSAEGPAHAAGLAGEDILLTLNGREVDSWYDINTMVEEGDGSAMTVSFRRGDDVLSTRLVPVRREGRDLFGDPLTYFEIGAAGTPELPAVIGEVSEGFPAKKAGIRAGDRIVAIDGRSIEKWKTLQTVIGGSDGGALEIVVARADDTRHTFTVTPRGVEETNAGGQPRNRYLIGIAPAAADIPLEDRVTKRLGPVEAAVESLERTWLIVELTVRGFGKMIRGTVSRDNLGGPIMITQMAVDQAKKGLDRLIQFVAFISINLAILNFLPIPVLDGGHLLFFFLELARGRPVSLRIREIAQQAGMALLLLLMIFVFYNDLTR